MKKHKTKEALKRYKEINHMLEKIQREAAKLGNDYANKVILQMSIFIRRVGICASVRFVLTEL